MRKILKALLLALMAIAMVSCTQYVYWPLPNTQGGGSTVATTIADVTGNVDVGAIFEAAMDADDPTAKVLSVETVPAGGGSSVMRAAGDMYRVRIQLTGFIGADGGTVNGIVAYLLTALESGYSYTVEQSTVTVQGSGADTAVSATVSGFTGTIDGVTVDDVTDTVTAAEGFAVTADDRDGEYTVGGETITESEANGLGNGSAEDPFVIDSEAMLHELEAYTCYVLRFDSAVELTAPINVTVPGVVINLGGSTLRYGVSDGTHTAVFIVTGEGELTLDGTGTVDAYSGSYCSPIRVYAGGSVVVNGGNYSTTSGDGFCIGTTVTQDNKFVDWTDGSLVMNGGTLEAREYGIGVWGASTLLVNAGSVHSTNNAVIGTNGTAYDTETADREYPEYSITIHGGTFEGEMDHPDYIANGVYAANRGNVLIDGGTFNITDGAAIVIRAGNATITDGVVINSTKENTSKTHGQVCDSKVPVHTGLNIVVDELSEYPGGDMVVTNTSDYPSVGPDGSPYPEGN